MASQCRRPACMFAACRRDAYTTKEHSLHAEEAARMAPTLPPFPTTVVGSMPRPQYVKDLLASGSRTGDHDAGWQRRMDNAVRHVIGMQEQAGIDIISDGEWRRESYVDVIAEMLTGFRWIKRDVFAYHQVVTERVTPRRPGVVAEEARFLKQNT